MYIYIYISKTREKANSKGAKGIIKINLFYKKYATYSPKWSQVHIMTDIKTSGAQIKSCKTSHILLLSNNILGEVDIIKFNCLL